MLCLLWSRYVQVDPSVTFDTVGGLDHYIKVGAVVLAGRLVMCGSAGRAAPVHNPAGLQGARSAAPASQPPALLLLAMCRL